MAGKGAKLKAFALVFKAIQAHDVVDLDLLLEAEFDFVAKQQVLAQAYNVARQAGVLGADFFRTNDLHFLAAEQVQALLVELFDLLAQRYGTGSLQPVE